MAWPSTYDDTNKIIEGRTVLEHKFYTTIAGSPEDGDVIGVKRVDVLTRYRYVGMTYAMAVDCQDAINDPASDVIAQLERENAAGMYCVQVTETVKGEYEDIIYTAPA
jgi:hypothetical protein